MIDISELWRESEAYAVPMTDEGLRLAEHRRRGFHLGYAAGLKQAVEHLMELHKEAQDGHNFYHVAANKVMELRK